MRKLGQEGERRGGFPETCSCFSKQCKNLCLYTEWRAEALPAKQGTEVALEGIMNSDLNDPALEDFLRASIHPWP